MAPLCLLAPRRNIEGPLGEMVFFPHAFCPQALNFMTNQRFLVSAEPKIVDKIVISDDFYKYRCGRNVEYVTMPIIIAHVDKLALNAGTGMP